MNADTTTVLKGLCEARDLLEKRVAERYRGYSLGAVTNAIKLIKSYQPRLLRLDEIPRKMSVWIEFRDKPRWLECIGDANKTQRIVLAIGGSSAGYAKCFITEDDLSIALNDWDYNVTWRAWTGEPTVEQIDSEEWNKKED